MPASHERVSPTARVIAQPALRHSSFRISSMTDFEQLASSLAPLYRLERELGHGAMGTVFVADTEEGARVALKVLSRDLAGMMTAPDAFVRAIGRAGRAQHAGLLPFAGAGTTPQGDLYYAMSLVEGPTARDQLASDGVMSADAVGDLGAHLADALAAAHEVGLVHGNVSPANVHLSGARVLLADLGVYPAMVEAGIGAPRINAMFGAPQYMSPEQLAGRAIDGRSDVYSLGATLYELLTGKPPFGGRTTSVVMASVLADEPTSLTGTGSDEPGTVVSAILRAIEKSPDDRWSSSAAFARALRDRTPLPVSVAAAPRKGLGCLPSAAAALCLAVASALLR